MQCIVEAGWLAHVPPCEDGLEGDGRQSLGLLLCSPRSRRAMRHGQGQQLESDAAVRCGPAPPSIPLQLRGATPSCNPRAFISLYMRVTAATLAGDHGVSRPAGRRHGVCGPPSSRSRLLVAEYHMRVKDDGILFPVEREDGQGLGCAWGIEDVAGRVANVNKGAACVG